jgi:hypothetical protein
VGGRVLAELALVVAGRDHLAVVDDDRADRHVVVLERALRLAEGEAHEVLVAREEAGVHGWRRADRGARDGASGETSRC